MSNRRETPVAIVDTIIVRTKERLGENLGNSCAEIKRCSEKCDIVHIVVQFADKAHTSIVS